MSISVSCRFSHGVLFLRRDLVEMLHDGKGQFAAALAVDGGDGEVTRIFAERLEEGGDLFGAIVFLQQVELVQYQPARLVVQALVVFLQFVQDSMRLVHRVDALVQRGHVDQMQQQRVRARWRRNW